MSFILLATFKYSNQKENSKTYYYNNCDCDCEN